MFAKRIIPCLDCKHGRVVKGIQFLNLRDAGDPGDLAEAYNREGADELVLLDISASREGRATLMETVHRVARRLFIPLTVGGGVRTLEDAQRLLSAGADKVGVNTAASLRPALVTELADAFGRQCVVAAVDVKRDAELGWRVYLKGGTEATDRSAMDWLWELNELGAGEILLTSMDRDGTGDGFDLELTRAVADAVPIPVVASGGVGSLDDMVDGVRDGRASAVLAASIFHFGTFTIRQAKDHMAAAGIPVRRD